MFDGGKPNSVSLITQTATIIYLTQHQFCWRRAKIDIFTRKTGAGRPANFYSP
jgi:hypothetical protein